MEILCALCVLYMFGPLSSDHKSVKLFNENDTRNTQARVLCVSAIVFLLR